MFLTNEGVKFVHLTEAYCIDVFRLWSDRDSVAYTNWRYTADLETCRQRLKKVLEYYQKNSHSFGPYAVIDHSDKFLGIAGADAVQDMPGRYDIWYFLDRRYRGNGIGNAMLDELLYQLRTQRIAQLVTAEVVAQNMPSHKMLQRAGFEVEKVLAGGFEKHGERRDLYLYSTQLKYSL